MQTAGRQFDQRKAAYGEIAGLRFTLDGELEDQAALVVGETCFSSGKNSVFEQAMEALDSPAGDCLLLVNQNYVRSMADDFEVVPSLYGSQVIDNSAFFDDFHDGASDPAGRSMPVSHGGYFSAKAKICSTVRGNRPGYPRVPCTQ